MIYYNSIPTKTYTFLVLIMLCIIDGNCQFSNSGADQYFVNQGLDANANGTIDGDEFYLFEGEKTNLFLPDIKNYYYDDSFWNSLDTNTLIYDIEMFISMVPGAKVSGLEFEIYNKISTVDLIYDVGFYPFSKYPGNVFIHKGIGNVSLTLDNVQGAAFSFTFESTNKSNAYVFEINEIFSEDIDDTINISGITYNQISLKNIYLSEFTVDPTLSFGSCSFRNVKLINQLDFSNTSLGYHSFSVKGESDLNFICAKPGFENGYDIDSQLQIEVSSNCELSKNTNMENGELTALGLAILNSNPSIDITGDSVIQAWELNKADTLIIKDFGLDIIDSLLWASNISYLDLSGNNLDYFDINNFPNLTYLDVSGNNIDSINFNTIETLANGGGIETLSGSGNYPLNSFISNNTMLSSLDVSVLDDLEFLEVNNNPNLNVICVSENQYQSYQNTWGINESIPLSSNCNVITTVKNLNATDNYVYFDISNSTFFFSRNLKSIIGMDGKILIRNNSSINSQSLTSLSQGVYLAIFNDNSRLKVIVK